MKFTLLIVLIALGAATGWAGQTPGAHAGAESWGADTNLPSMPVGADDLLSLNVYDSPELNRTVRVAQDGTIRLPLLKNKVKVGGMMPTEIESAVAKELQVEGILTDPVVTVSVAEYKSRPISVVGAVRNPVIFQALPGTTLLDAITQAQGLSENSGPDIIVTRRVTAADGKTESFSQRVSAKALVEGADAALNLHLSGGEEVRVPEAGKVFVVGQVHKPGAYPVRQDADSTVLKAIALSEGLDKYANKNAYIIRREGPAGKQEIPVELSKILNRKSPDVPLQPNDILYIPDSQTKKLTLGSLAALMALGTAGATTLVYTAR